MFCVCDVLSVLCAVMYALCTVHIYGMGCTKRFVCCVVCFVDGT